MTIRVVAIDDEEELLELYAAMLEPYGCDIVAVAKNGARGLTAVAAADPDVVLLDLSMPDQDGLEALITLHKQQRRVVVLSGLGAARIADIARGLGASDYLEKGVPAKELAARIVAAAKAPVPVIDEDKVATLQARMRELI